MSLASQSGVLTVLTSASVYSSPFVHHSESPRSSLVQILVPTLPSACNLVPDTPVTAFVSPSMSHLNVTSTEKLPCSLTKGATRLLPHSPSHPVF